jgi:hypothetical protein
MEFSESITSCEM